jgi:hypothetical protein
VARRLVDDGDVWDGFAAGGELVEAGGHGTVALESVDAVLTAWRCW